MIIKCKNISSFCKMIENCFSNEIDNIIVYISSHNTYPSVATPKAMKTNITFTYVAFTPLYTVVYDGNIPSSEYDSIYESLSNFQDLQAESNHTFSIHVFEELYLNKENTMLTINNETNFII